MEWIFGTDIVSPGYATCLEDIGRWAYQLISCNETDFKNRKNNNFCLNLKVHYYHVMSVNIIGII